MSVIGVGQASLLAYIKLLAKGGTLGENGVGFSNFEMTKNDVYNKKVLENPGFVKVFSSPLIQSLDLQDLDLP